MKKLKVFETAGNSYKKENIDSIANVLQKDGSRKLIVIMNDKSQITITISADEWDKVKNDGEKLKDLAIQKLNQGGKVNEDNKQNIKDLLSQKGYDPIFVSIDKSYKDFIKLGDSRQEAIEYLLNSYNIGDEKINDYIKNVR